MAKSNRAIETPGATTEPTPTAAEPITSAPSQEDAGQATAAPADAPIAGVTGAAPAVANSAEADKAKDEEAARRAAETADLVGSDKALDWAHLSNPARLMALVGANAPEKDPNAHLPTPDQVDWSKVKDDRVLTKQGWLLRP